MLRKLILISLIFLFVPFGALAYEIPDATKEFYVNDFAEVLTEETENMIKGSGQRMYDEFGMQIVVTSIESLDGAPVEEYALKMARKYQIGSEKDNGILILLSVSDRALRIEVGKGLEGDMNDAKAGRFMDEYAIPFLSENDFDGGINNLYRALLIEFGLAEVEAPYTSSEEDDTVWLEILIALIIFGCAFYFSYKSVKNGGSGSSGGGYYGGSGGYGGSSGSGGGGFSSSGGGGGFSGGGASRNF